MEFLSIGFDAQRNIALAREFIPKADNAGDRLLLFFNIYRNGIVHFR
jgi:hypothetical protein